MKLRKVMLLAAMLAMVLAAAVPAFAQANAVQYDGDDETATFCNQVQAITGDINQGQYGDANAAATDDSEAVAAAANELNVSQEQVLNCFVGENNGVNQQGNVGTVGVADVDDDADGVVDEDDGTETEVIEDDGTVVAADDDDATVVAAEEGSASAAAATAAAAGELPETGGASLLALGAGALLVAGGLVARRIVR